MHDSIVERKRKENRETRDHLLYPDSNCDSVWCKPNVRNSKTFESNHVLTNWMSIDVNLFNLKSSSQTYI